MAFAEVAVSFVDVAVAVAAALFVAVCPADGVVAFAVVAAGVFVVVVVSVVVFFSCRSFKECGG